MEGSEAHQEASEELPVGFEGLPEGLPEGLGGTDVWTDGWSFSPFYWTSSPIGTAAKKGKVAFDPTSIQDQQKT